MRAARTRKDNKAEDKVASNIVVKKPRGPKTPPKVEKLDHEIVGQCKYESYVLPRLQDIYDWLVDGYTEYSIAKNLGIAHNTLIDYKKKYPEIIEVYTRARKERNALVMNKMFSKSCGMVAEVKQEKLTKEGSIVALKSEIYTPPDVNAADLYLRNNDPEYKSAKSAEVGGSTTINFNVAELSSKRAELLTELQKLSSIDVKAIE